MIDIDHMIQYCPIEVVEYVSTANPRDPIMTLWPNGDYFGDKYDEDCKFAVLDYYSDGIGQYSNKNWDSAYMQLALDYIDKVPPPLAEKIHNAMRRLISSDKLLLGWFFAILHREHPDLDMRNELHERFVEMPTAEEIESESNSEKEEYLLYLALWGDQAAFKEIEKTIANMKAPGKVLSYLEVLYMLDIPGREKIFRTYINDGRSTSDVNGNIGLAVADWARVFLGMPRYTGKRIHLNAAGEVVEYKDTPAGQGIPPYHR